MSEANAAQIEYWNGKAGERWARRQERIDASLAEVTKRALALRRSGAGPARARCRLRLRNHHAGAGGGGQAGRRGPGHRHLPSHARGCAPARGRGWPHHRLRRSRCQRTCVPAGLRSGVLALRRDVFRRPACGICQHPQGAEAARPVAFRLLGHGAGKPLGDGALHGGPRSSAAAGSARSECTGPLRLRRWRAPEAHPHAKPVIATSPSTSSTPSW